MNRTQHHYARAVIYAGDVFSRIVTSRVVVTRGLKRLLLALLIAGGSPTGHAATVVDVQTVFGAFTLELYEQHAPQTVSRFLENVDNRVYNLTMVHWAGSGMLRGGLFGFDTCAEGPIEVAPGVRHEPEDTGLNNDFGTLAMRRDPQNPDLLSNEWQLNLASGVEDDGADSAPVVFGKIISGKSVTDAIHFVPRVSLGQALPFIPLINYNFDFGLYSCSLISRENIVFVTMQSREVVNTYDGGSDRIHVQVDAGEAGYLGVSFQVESVQDGTIRALPESLVELETATDGMASYDPDTGELVLPELAIGDDVPYVDVVLLLTDPENLVFTLQSVETP